MGVAVLGAIRGCRGCQGCIGGLTGSVGTQRYSRVIGSIRGNLGCRGLLEVHWGAGRECTCSGPAGVLAASGS